MVAVGTGQALAIGMKGDADALLVHDRPGEDKFVAEGYGIDRRDVMYNDFVIVGPKADPAGVKGLKDAAAPSRKIADGQGAIRHPRRRQRHQPAWSCACGRPAASTRARPATGTASSARAWGRPSTPRPR